MAAIGDYNIVNYRYDRAREKCLSPWFEDIIQTPGPVSTENVDLISFLDSL